jgi:hypothetical protein
MMQLKGVWYYRCNNPFCGVLRPEDEMDHERDENGMRISSRCSPYCPGIEPDGYSPLPVVQNVDGVSVWSTKRVGD